MTVYVGDNCIAQGHTGDGAAGSRQAPEGMPARTVKSEGSIVRHAVLLCEAAEGIEPVAPRGSSVIVSHVCGRIIGVMVGPIDPLFGIAADQMDAPSILRCPGHLRARDRQRGALARHCPFAAAEGAGPPLHVAGAGRGDRCGPTPRATMRPCDHMLPICSNQSNRTPTRYSLRHTTRHGSRNRSSGMINVNSLGMRRRSENSSAAPVLDMSRTMHRYLSPP